MKKLLLISVFALSLPLTSLAAPTKNSTTMVVDYENVQQLIKNQYAAREGCRSLHETPETSIMCQYADAASKQLGKLGYCMGNEDQPAAEWEWRKCSQQSKKTTTVTTATATQATTVSEAIINDAVTDTKASFCNINNKGNLTVKRLDFAQHILGCYLDSKQSPDKLPVCILEDLSFWVYDKNLRAASPIYDQNYPSDKQFFSAVDFNDRLQEYIVPRFGYLPDALNYFDPGIDKVTDTMLSCVK